MKAAAMQDKISLQKGGLQFSFHPSGDLYKATAADGQTMINQMLASPLDGALNNIYARLHLADGIQAYPLLGTKSASRFCRDRDRLIWRGEIKAERAGGGFAGAVSYEVIFTLAGQGVWFWDVKLDGSQACSLAEKERAGASEAAFAAADAERGGHGGRGQAQADLQGGLGLSLNALNGSPLIADIVYGQDVGIAAPGAVRSNEAYLSQYIDHAVFEDDARGFVVCSRQNQPQSGRFPYLQQGSLTKAAGYSTDGFQFFGLSYKETDQPVSLPRETLANEVYQYEFAYTALQSAKTELSSPRRFVFYGLFREDHPEAVAGVEFADLVDEAWREAESSRAGYAAETGGMRGEGSKGSHLTGTAGQSADFASISASVSAADTPDICAGWPGSAAEWLEPVRLSPKLGRPLQTLPMLQEELDRLYPGRKQEEWEGGRLLAFFTESYEHVVLKEKELLVERPHGHILMSGDNARQNSEVLTTTSYMYGIFNSQVVVGNTNFNKMMSNARNALNVSKVSGQRIYVETDGQFHLLALPSLFEMGFNYARWYYKTSSDTLIITNYTSADSPEVRLHVRSVSGAAYRFLITNQITMNVDEYEVPFHMKREAEDRIVFLADQDSFSSGVYPQLQYRLQLDGAAFTLGDETVLAEGPAGGSSSLAVLCLEPAGEWTLTMQGALNGLDGKGPARHRPADEEIERYRAFYTRIMNGFKLTESGGQEGGLFKVNALAWWYTHNMLVHYSVPHGLEQYGGAAWGTRDVCQGPTEYFMATHNYAQVREILLTVYAHQYEEDGSWPQWFMFDKYTEVQQEESHGDIIVWPLKVLGDYLTASGDFSILDECIPFTRKQGFAFTGQVCPVRDHVKKELDYIKEHFLHDTFLSAYGDGDWDDTLQPANARLKQYMVSSWTVALTYQAVKQLSRALKNEAAGSSFSRAAEGLKTEAQGVKIRIAEAQAAAGQAAKGQTAECDAGWAAELQVLAEGIQKDFHRYMLGTDVIPGFLYFEDPEEPKLMLHPSDGETGIQYRLLPMTRSMISELLTPEEMERHLRLIQEHLLCPDGVRLMNRPAQYVGGVSVHFKRAEQAANFGREIGLQYVHAHIRYVEAMAKIGQREQAWNALAVINPVGIREVVPNAELRQSNAYFSSSDGKFSTRYEAQERFDELRSGKAAVKGGWRIYSSGPGIYMNQLISNVLGIRLEGGDLVIDPVLPPELDGTRFDFEYDGQPVAFIYRYSDGTLRDVAVNGQAVPTETLPNPYRAGGLRIKHADFCRARRLDGQDIIEIRM